MKTQLIHQSTLKTTLESIGVQECGQKIMQKKGEIFLFLLKDLKITHLQILKQELLSVGGDLATPKEAILGKDRFYNALIIATKSQLLRVIEKCKIQPFGLKNLANTLASHLKPYHFTPRLMQIINLTPDSFYKDSRHTPKQAIQKIESLIETGANLFDIGAASSRPGSELVDYKIEIERLKELCLHIKKHNLYKKAQFSIDTYNPQTADFALDSGFSIINDVSGISNPQMFDVIKNFEADVILMHSKGTPKTMTQMTDYEDFFYEMDCFFEEKIEILRTHNARNIILDIGFGFAKTDNQNLSLIQNLAHFKHFGLELLVGASNKSTIGTITNQSDSNTRLSGTLTLHLIALQNGASILRVHNYKEHLDMLKIYQALNL